MHQSKKTLTKRKNPSKNQVRIIGGSLGGRIIRFVDAEGLRPTLNQIRETLFNWLANKINGANCLDLYAGSGAIGFEAISRGAQSVTMVDADLKVSKELTVNRHKLAVDNLQVVHQRAEKFLEKNSQVFDLVFLDPPFDKGVLKPIINQIKPHLAENALVYVEQENNCSKLKFSAEWKIVKSKNTRRFCCDLITMNTY